MASSFGRSDCHFWVFPLGCSRRLPRSFGTHAESSPSLHDLPALAIVQLIVAGLIKYMSVSSDSVKSMAENLGWRSLNIGYPLLSLALPLYQLDCFGSAGRREYFASADRAYRSLNYDRYSTVHWIVPVIGSAFFGAG